MENVPVNEDKNHGDKDKSKHSTAGYDDISRAVLWGSKEQCIHIRMYNHAFETVVIERKFHHESKKSL